MGCSSSSSIIIDIQFYLWAKELVRYQQTRFTIIVEYLDKWLKKLI